MSDRRLAGHRPGKTPLHGDPAPTFVTEALTNPRYVFDTAALRYLLLVFVKAGPAVEAAAWPRCHYRYR